MYKKLVWAATVLLLILGQNSQAQEHKGEGEYTAPLSSFLKHRLDDDNPRYDPLLAITDIEIPQSEKTVLDAMTYVLAGTSYDINSSVVSNPVTSEIIKKKIPTIQRKMDGVTKLEAIKYLIGQHHVVLIDPVLRQIGFDLVENLPGREQ